MTAPTTQPMAPAPGWYRLSEDEDEQGALYLERLSDGTV